MEEIIQALAQQQYDFEKSINVPYKSPPRGLKKKIDYDLESATDCDEYFDAFDDEEEPEMASSSKQADIDKDEKQSLSEEASSKIQESEAFEVIHDLQRFTPTKR